MQKSVQDYLKVMKVLGSKMVYLDINFLAERRIGIPPRNVILFDQEYLPHFSDFPSLLNIGHLKVKFCNRDFVASRLNFLKRHKYSSKFSLDGEEAIKIAKGSIKDEKKLERAVKKIKQAVIRKKEIWASSYMSFYLYNYVNLYSWTGESRQVHLLSPQDGKEYINIVFINEVVLRSPMYEALRSRKDDRIRWNIQNSEVLAGGGSITMDKGELNPKGYQLYIGKW